MNPETDAHFQAGRITRTVSVKAPQDITWSCLTDPQAIERWWGHPAQFPDGMRDGSLGTFEWVGHGLMPMRIMQFQEPSRFSLLWGEPGDPIPGEDASLVEFTLGTDGSNETAVTVVESGFDRLPEAEK
ncbi:ATPase [Kocuria sp. JC486]|uniref:SRPBCC domain-containing protein n=1 Tax=Kocuria sp. JC486 TaxID=1970736 RepID=UPI0014209241|nr:SRPBCC domain-containing protein [Kocuria sp. JC486]NHU86141.1 ATPase [Kocuria sp. JC486]